MANIGLIVDLHLQSILYKIIADLDEGSDYYIIYCRFYFFDDKAYQDAPVLFHKEHIFKVKLIGTGMLCDRMPESSNTFGAFTIRIPFDQIKKITKVDPNHPDDEIIVFSNCQLLN